MDTLTTTPPNLEKARLPWLRIAGWTVFALAFGYTEAALVVYLRRLMGEGYGLDYRQIFARKHLDFSSASIAQDMARHGFLTLERSREIATLLLLAGAAWGGGQTARERLAVFLYTFALWDESYYLFLLPWTGFPRSLSSTDLYFLVPVAWYGPVWLPVLVAMPLFIIAALRLWRVPDQRSRAQLHPDKKGALHQAALPKD